MKILVCISNVPDTTTKIKLADGNTKIDTAGIQWVINPWDELSLTRALEIKDDPAAGVSAVTVIHVGLPTAEPTIRKALAIGADDAVRVNSEAHDAYFTAAQIADVARKENYDLIMCGIESSDHNGSLVGAMVAEFLGFPLVSSVTGLKIENNKPLITREVDGGKEVVSVALPCVTVVQKGIAKEPRIAAMRGIMMARSKPITVAEPISVEPLTEVKGFELPQPRAACKYIDPENPADLIRVLQNEAKVI